MDSDIFFKPRCLRKVCFVVDLSRALQLELFQKSLLQGGLDWLILTIRSRRCGRKLKKGRWLAALVLTVSCKKFHFSWISEPRLFRGRHETIWCGRGCPVKAARKRPIVKVLLWMDDAALRVSLAFLNTHLSERNGLDLKGLSSVARIVERWNDVVDS